MKNYLSVAALLLLSSSLASAQGNGDVVQSVSVFIDRQQSFLSSLGQQVQTDTERSSDYAAYSSIWNSVSAELVAITSEAATNAAASSTLSTYWSSLAPYVDELNNAATAQPTTSITSTSSSVDRTTTTSSITTTATSSRQPSETTTSSGSGSDNNQTGVAATFKSGFHLGVMGSAAASILALAVLL